MGFLSRSIPDLDYQHAGQCVLCDECGVDNKIPDGVFIQSIKFRVLLQGALEQGKQVLRAAFILILRPLWIAQRTVFGRLLLGPAMVIVPTWWDIVRRPLLGDFSQSRSWAVHLALLAAMLVALDRYTGIGPVRYLLTICYPALGLAMFRSFYEHRPAAEAAHRVVINEAALFWRILYLNNN